VLWLLLLLLLLLQGNQYASAGESNVKIEAKFPRILNLSPRLLANSGQNK